jgi:hypothetical protein
MGAYMVGMSGGGFVAILMKDTGLFEPLYLAIGLSFQAGLYLQFRMVEARAPGSKSGDGDEKTKKEEKPEDQHEDAPKTIDWRAFWVIMVGVVLDNIGSQGPTMCLAPLSLNSFNLQPLSEEKEPFMTYETYQWITVTFSLAIMVGMAFTPMLYKNAGFSGGFILGNIITGGVTLALMYAAKEISQSGFVTFMVLFYCAFPFTVFSQLTTAPMIDIISPVDKRGTMQGYNNAGKVRDAYAAVVATAPPPCSVAEADIGADAAYPLCRSHNTRLGGGSSDYGRSPRADGRQWRIPRPNDDDMDMCRLLGRRHLCRLPVDG